MIAKVISWAPTREASRMPICIRHLGDSLLYGVETNRDYLRQILLDAPFASGQPWTRCLEGLVVSGQHLRECSAPAPRPAFRTIPGASAIGR